MTSYLNKTTDTLANCNFDGTTLHARGTGTPTQSSSAHRQLVKLLIAMWCFLRNISTIMTIFHIFRLDQDQYTSSSLASSDEPFISAVNFVPPSSSSATPTLISAPLDLNQTLNKNQIPTPQTLNPKPNPKPKPF